MATAVAATVNGGYLGTPYVVDYMTDDTGNVVWQAEPEIRRQVVSEEVSEQIRVMMENNVGSNINDTTHKCRNAYVAGYRIGGKSGTGEQLDWKGVYKYRPDGDYRKAISFAAILPADDPEILVLVMLDDPRWIYDYASQIVATVTGNIISQIAPYLGIERDSSYDATGTVKVPNLIGTRPAAPRCPPAPPFTVIPSPPPTRRPQCPTRWAKPEPLLCRCSNPQASTPGCPATLPPAYSPRMWMPAPPYRWARW